MDQQHRFAKTFQELGLKGDYLPLYENLRCAYRQPWRHHHNWGHIVECIVLLDKLAHLAENPAEVAWSLMWHDYVWTPHMEGSPGDELRSAIACKLITRAYGWGDRVVKVADRCYRNIMATASRGEPQTGDAALTADIDMSILGKPWERYQQYAGHVEQEFCFGNQYAENEWCIGRQVFLRRTLDSELFHLPYFRTTYQTQAQLNMRYESEILKKRMDELKGY